MQVLVTGGAGFIGSELCKELLKTGHDVISLDLIPSTVPNIKSIIRDITDPTLGWIKDWQNIDVCYHLAAMANVDKVRVLQQKAFDVNILGTFNIANICQQNNIKMIFASTACVYGHTYQHPSTEEGPTFPADLYGATKRAGEELVKLVPNWVILRFGTTLGKGMRPALATYIFLKQSYDRVPLTITGDGFQSRNWIYIDDLIRGCVKVLRYNITKEIINLVGRKTNTVNEMASMASEVVKGGGKINQVKHLPNREGDVMKEDISIDKASMLLKWGPIIDLKEGLQLSYNHLKKEWNKQ